MAIAFDNATISSNASGSFSYSHTCTGSDLALFVFVTVNTGQTCSGVTYNSVSMTEQGSYIQDSAGPRTYAFYLLGPATGSNSISITVSGGNTVGSAASYTGVSQSGFPDAYTTTAGGITTSFTSTITTVASNAWIIASSRCGNGATLTGNGGTVVRQQPEVVYLGGGAIWDEGPIATPASTDLNVTSANQLFGGAHVISFAPATASGATSVQHNLTLMGVG